MSWLTEVKAIPPDAKTDDIPLFLEQPSKLAITLHGHRVEAHEDHNGEYCTINGQRSKFGFFETVQKISEKANETHT